MRRFIFNLGATFTLLTTPAFAETEDALYGASVPADAVFVRQIGADGTEIDLFGQPAPLDLFPEATYVAISAGDLPTSVPGTHYTILANSQGSTLIIEPPREDRRKVYLFLLNADADIAQIAVADGGPVVIEDVPTGEMLGRAVNPISAKLTVTAADLSEDFDVVLRRKVHLTFLVNNGEISVIEDAYGPVIEEFDQ